MKLTADQKSTLINSIDETIFFLEDLKTVFQTCEQDYTISYNISLTLKRICNLHSLLYHAYKWSIKKHK